MFTGTAAEDEYVWHVGKQRGFNDIEDDAWFVL
jgi:hypothetical protein